MERATAPQMRLSLLLAEAYKKMGIRFVPMPAADDTEFDELSKEADSRLGAMIAKIERGE